MIISINPESPQKNLIKKVVNILNNGGIIAYPTDTVYGIGGNIMDSKAIEKIFALKKRKKENLVSFIYPDINRIEKYAKVTDTARDIMKQFLPGPYTFILEAKKDSPFGKTVGIRIPANKICMQIVYELDAPLCSTSANISGEPEMLTPYQINNTIGDQLDLIIDGGKTYSYVSSVIDISGKKPIILRKGKGDVKYFLQKTL